MHIHPGALAVTGSLCLGITLVLAWCLAGARAAQGFKRLFPNQQYLLKAHIDYLLMCGLLMIFYLSFAHFGIAPSPVIVASMCAGSLLNPFGFLVLAVKPNTRQQPTSPFGALMTASFTLTTIGYGGAAWYVGRAALLSAAN
jgi:hypothetical protein